MELQMRIPLISDMKFSFQFTSASTVTTSSMKILSKLALFPLLGLLLGPARTLAQSPTAPGKVPVGVAEAGLGYSYVNSSIAPSNRVGLNGLDANATVYIPARFGIKFDLGYARAANVFSTNHHADMLTYLVGPVVYPVARGGLRTYVHVLFGGARTTGPVPVGGGSFFTAYANKFAWAVGGGLDYRLTRFSPRLSAHVCADYLHTAYFDPAQQISGRSNVRVVVGIVYSFRSRNR